MRISKNIMFSKKKKIVSLFPILKSFYKILQGGENSVDLPILKVLTSMNCPLALFAKHQQSFKEDADSELIPIDEVSILKRTTHIFFVQGNFFFSPTFIFLNHVIR